MNNFPSLYGHGIVRLSESRGTALRRATFHPSNNGLNITPMQALEQSRSRGKVRRLKRGDVSDLLIDNSGNRLAYGCSLDGAAGCAVLAPAPGTHQSLGSEPSISIQNEESGQGPCSLAKVEHSD
jgi:hypothetical protein